MSAVSLRAILPSGESLNPILPALYASTPYPVHLTVETPSWTSFPIEAKTSLCSRLESLTWNVAGVMNDFLGELGLFNADISSFEHLQTLTLKGLAAYSFSDVTEEYTWPLVYLGELEKLPKLINLRMEKTLIEGSLTSNTLTSLIISSCTLENPCLEETIRGSPNLKLLSLSRVDAIYNPWDDFSVFVHPSLERIVISRFTGDTRWVFLYWGRYPNLRSLSICGLPSTARPDLYPHTPSELGECGPLERSFYYTVSRTDLFNILDTPKYSQQLLKNEGARLAKAREP